MCDYCGKFIGLDEFDNDIAKRVLETPDSEFTSERYLTFHMECKIKSFGVCVYPDWEGGLIKGTHSLDKDGYCNICGKKFIT